MVKVLNAGFYTSIQDFGRVGYQQYGVPYSGVMDTYAAGLANIILGNNENAAVLEMTMQGAKLQFEHETTICISGADMSPKCNNQPISMYKSLSVSQGDVLTFGKLNTGIRCYLAVSGGFKSERVLGSQSMYSGVTSQFKIDKNDFINFGVNHLLSNIKNASIKVNIDYFKSQKIHVFKGSEFDLLSENQQKKLLQQGFTISKDNNRMAYQLSESFENNLKPIITSPVMPGTVQLTPSGKLIILMRDCQTTGGYPRVLQLSDLTINVIAQKFTGDLINFNLV